MNLLHLSQLPLEVILLVFSYLDFNNLYKIYPEWPVAQKPFIHRLLINHSIFTKRQLIVVLTDIQEPVSPEYYSPGSLIPPYQSRPSCDPKCQIVSSHSRFDHKLSHIDYSKNRVWFKATSNTLDWVTCPLGLHITILLVQDNRIIKRMFKATVSRNQNRLDFGQGGSLIFDADLPKDYAQLVGCSMSIDWLCN
ncbi:hypothetical protein CLU79DRAFT_833897 [Phycomyces nitens]|nr:hypothetical protein CLU79DRAFT_833897 [Phycomyces nitens]